VHRLAAGGTAIDLAGSAAVPADYTGALPDLDPRWRQNAQWLAKLDAMNLLRTQTVGENLSTPALSEGNPASLSGRAVHENSYLPAGVVAVVGRLQKFVVIERIGTTVELIPNLLSANGLPIGARGFVMHRRVGL
jgi:HK97 family phage major capsid protein